MTIKKLKKELGSEFTVEKELNGFHVFVDNSAALNGEIFSYNFYNKYSYKKQIENCKFEYFDWVGSIYENLFSQVSQAERVKFLNFLNKERLLFIK